MGFLQPKAAISLSTSRGRRDIRKTLCDPVATSSLNLSPESNWASNPDLLFLSHAFVETTASVDGGLIESVLRNPIFWSCSVMIFIVILLSIWEWATEYVKEELPRPLRPVVEKILGEIGGLGFIGLLLESIFNPLFGNEVSKISEIYLGEEDILLEDFEFLHSAFFEVGVAFFIFAGYVVVNFVSKVSKLSQTPQLLLKEGQCTVTDDLLANEMQAVNFMTDVPLSDEDIQKRLAAPERFLLYLQGQLMLDECQCGSESILVRNSLVKKFPHLEKDEGLFFQINNYIERIFGDNLCKVVELSPLVWVPFIPTIGLANAVDLAHEVVNADSANAVASSGFFFSSPWVLIPWLTAQLVGLIWGIFNFWKMASIKQMVQPNIVKVNGEARIVPRLMDNPELYHSFESTPAFFKPFENIWSKATDSKQMSLFGVIGANGPDFYLNSIKYHMWLCITTIVVKSTQLLSRDAAVLLSGGDLIAGDPDHVLPELLTYGSFVIMDIAQLFIDSTSFTIFCFITSVGDLANEKMMKQSLEPVSSVDTTSTTF